MKTSFTAIAQNMLAPVTGRSRRKQAKEGGPQPGPSSSASSDIGSRRVSRGTPSDVEGETSAPRAARLPGTSSPSLDSTPTPSFRSDSVRDLPAGQGVVLNDHELDRLIQDLDATGPPQPVAAALTEYREQALKQLNGLTTLVATLTGSVEVRPLDAPDHRTHAQLRADYYHGMSDLITTLAADGRIKLGSGDQQQLGELQRLAGELGECAKVNPFSGEDAHKHHANRIAAREVLAEGALQPLLSAHLPELLSEIRDPTLLAQLAKDLLKQAAGPTGRLSKFVEQAVPPALLKARNEVAASIRKDIELAVAETALQKNMLELLGGAVLQLGEDKIKGLRGGLNHISRQFLHRKLAEKGGVDPRPRGKQVSDDIAKHFGTYFNVEVSKENKDKLEMSLKKESIGQFTMADFESQLGSLLQVEKPRTIAKAVGAAIVKSGEFELHQKGGPASVSLTEPERRRLDAMRLDTLGGPQPHEEAPTTHGIVHNLVGELTHHFQVLIERHGHPGAEHGHGLLTQASNALAEFAQMAQSREALSTFEDMPPKERLTLAASRAMHSAQLGLLKMSLNRSFGKLVTEKAQQGENPLQIHQGLTQAKASLLADMMEKVMGSPTKDLMLAHITTAEREHDTLWRETWKRPHGGETAELLKDMRSAVKRF